VVWEFLGHDPPVNVRRTLDQFGYPSMSDTSARDDDQMLYKMTRDDTSHVGLDNLDAQEDASSVDSDDEGITASDDEETGPLASKQNVRNGNLLMVDQLWMWTIDTS
jgi:hypothetical protein